MAIKEYECPNCGASLHLNNSKVIICEYCGSEVKNESSGDTHSLFDNFKQSFNANPGDFRTHITTSTTVTHNGKVIKGIDAEETQELMEDVNEMMSKIFEDMRD